MQKLYHVFVSSTYADLNEERQKVSQAIGKAGHVPEGMELFPASSQKQLDFIKRVIDRCDYYVVIVGGRYGSLADENVSYTEQEYNYASERGLSTLAFLHRHTDNLAVKKVDTEPSHVEMLAAFREKLQQSAMVDFWENPAELATAVVVALQQEITIRPGVGWVRGDQAADPQLFEELAKSRLRIAELESQRAVTTAEGASLSFPPDIAAPDATFVLAYKVVETVAADDSDPSVVLDEKVDDTISWRDAFIVLSDYIDRNLPEDELVDFLGITLSRRRFGRVVNDRRRTVDVITSAKKLRYQYEALGLISAITEERESKSAVRALSPSIWPQRTKPVVVWKLTAKGRQYVAHEMAEKRAG